jgi:hypothetical protein
MPAARPPNILAELRHRGCGRDPDTARPMKTASLQVEWLRALRGLDLDDARLLARQGLNLPLMVDLGFDAYSVMVGVLPMRVSGCRWQLDPTGIRGFVTPVRGHGDCNACDLLADETVVHGPLIDLVAWHPETPQQWATRAGVAEWLGAWDPGIAHERREPVRVWRAPFAWLKGWMDGVVPLTADPAGLYRLLADLPAIRAEDVAHGKQLQQALRRPYPVPVVDWPRSA